MNNNKPWERPDKKWERSLREFFYACGDCVVDVIKIWSRE